MKKRKKVIIVCLIILAIVIGACVYYYLNKKDIRFSHSDNCPSDGKHSASGDYTYVGYKWFYPSHWDCEVEDCHALCADTCIDFALDEACGDCADHLSNVLPDCTKPCIPYLGTYSCDFGGSSGGGYYISQDDPQHVRCYCNAQASATCKRPVGCTDVTQVPIPSSPTPAIPKTK
jgi:hypothetical protein